MDNLDVKCGICGMRVQQLRTERDTLKEQNIALRNGLNLLIQAAERVLKSHE